MLPACMVGVKCDRKLEHGVAEQLKALRVHGVVTAAVGEGLEDLGNRGPCAGVWYVWRVQRAATGRGENGFPKLVRDKQALHAR
jgi:hypothetical protein